MSLLKYPPGLSSKVSTTLIRVLVVAEPTIETSGLFSAERISESSGSTLQYIPNTIKETTTKDTP